MGFLGDVAGGIGKIGEFLAPGGAITGGLSSVLGSETIGDALTGGAMSNAKSISETNRMQMELAQKQMDFQERMSNTAYERAMADMKKAGLNPMLAFDKGGASTPSGAMATLQAPRKGDIGAGLFNTAKALVSGNMELQQSKSQVDLNRANQQVADVSAEKIGATAIETKENTELLRQRLKTEREDTRSARAQARQRELDTKVSEKRRPIDEKLAPIDAWMDRIGQALSLPGNILRGFGRKQGGQAPSPGTFKKQYDDMINRSGQKGIKVP